MRLWSLHPAVLDRAALIACWREALLAQKVLAGGTRGYTRHPQLERFRACTDPLDAIGHFLGALADEADARGYRFDRARILRNGPDPAIPVTTGQLRYEEAWLRTKVAQRAPEWLDTVRADAAPSFRAVPGGIEPWERVGQARPEGEGTRAP